MQKKKLYGFHIFEKYFTAPLFYLLKDFFYKFNAVQKSPNVIGIMTP